MWSTSSLPLLPGSLWAVVVAPVPTIGQIERINHFRMIIIIIYLKFYSRVQIIYIT